MTRARKSVHWVAMRRVSFGVCLCVACGGTRPPAIKAPASSSDQFPRIQQLLPGNASTPTGAIEPRAESIEKTRLAFAEAYAELPQLAATARPQAIKKVLAELGQALPVTRRADLPGAYMDSSSVSADGRYLLLPDTESLLLAEADTGRPLGFAPNPDGSRSRATFSIGGQLVAHLDRAQLVLREVPTLREVIRVASRPGAPYSFGPAQQLVVVRSGIGTAADDELHVLDAKTGASLRALPLTAPVPDAGLARRVAGLPRVRDCGDDETCLAQELQPDPIGRRVEQLHVVDDYVAVGWQGGSSTIHRLSDGKLLGAFRPRGETWKSGLIAVQSNPPRAAVATSPRVVADLGPPLSVTALLDLERGQVIALLDECRWVSDLAFAENGSHLVVGDLLHACFHDARNGSYVGKTLDVREAWQHDDLQDVRLKRLGDSRWVLTTADGSWAVVEAASGKTILRGFASEPTIVDGETFYATNAAKTPAELVIVEPQSIHARPLSKLEAERAAWPPEMTQSVDGKLWASIHRALYRTCSFRGFRIPAELCESAPAQLPPAAATRPDGARR